MSSSPSSTLSPQATSAPPTSPRKRRPSRQARLVGLASSRTAGRTLAAATAVSAVAAVGVGVLEARLPVGPGNSAVHHGYPFFAVAMALVLAVVGARASAAAPRWSLLVRLDGLAYAVNALLIAAVSYAVTPEGHGLPLAGLAWLADVLFPLCDVTFIGLVVGLLPDVRPRGLHRPAVAALLALTGLTMLGEALVPHVLDSTRVANPVGLGSLSGMRTPLEVTLLLMFLSAVLLSVVRGLVLGHRLRRGSRGDAAAARGAGLAVLLTFLGQAAAGESSSWAAGAVMLLGCVATATLASRVAVSSRAEVVR
jgi:hypothetical protein